MTTVVNAVGNALTGTTGTGNFVGANTPTLITPVIGAATGTSLVTSGNITAGLGAGGSPGTLISFPTTTAKGRLVVAAADNATGAFDTTISNGTAIGQSQVVSIPDSGASTAKFILSTGAGQTIGNGLTLTTPVIGAASATSVTFTSTSGIIGTTTNDSAAAGSVGEYVTAAVTSASPTSLTNNTVTNLPSISLTAGDWDVWGNVGFIPAATTNYTVLIGFISSSSATLISGEQRNTVSSGAGGTVTGGNEVSFSVPGRRFSLTTTTTVYLEVNPFFTVSTMTGYGSIYARRRR
jgi:hypothetical protein